MTDRFDRRNREFFDRVGVYVNWELVDGLELRVSHNSLGMRGPELTGTDLERDLIFVYGGSTTYDEGVSDGDTWVERLQADLRNKYTVANFGVPWYGTAEHVVQTAFYQRVLGKQPICAVYYVGWNDIGEAYVEKPDSAYSDTSALIKTVRAPELFFASYSPVMRLINMALVNRFDTVPNLSKVYVSKPIPDSLARLERIFVEHVNTIKAINDARGVKTVFVGQILNREMGLRHPDGAAELGDPPLGELWPQQERFNSILRNAALLSGAPYIDAGIDNFTMNDFVDEGHFSAAGSKKFAALISTRVDSYCQ